MRKSIIITLFLFFIQSSGLCFFRSVNDTTDYKKKYELLLKLLPTKFREAADQLDMETIKFKEAKEECNREKTKNADLQKQINSMNEKFNESILKKLLMAENINIALPESITSQQNYMNFYKFLTSSTKGKIKESSIKITLPKKLFLYKKDTVRLDIILKNGTVKGLPSIFHEGDLNPIIIHNSDVEIEPIEKTKNFLYWEIMAKSKGKISLDFVFDGIEITSIVNTIEVESGDWWILPFRYLRWLLSEFLFYLSTAGVLLVKFVEPIMKYIKTFFRWIKRKGNPEDKPQVDVKIEGSSE